MDSNWHNELAAVIDIVLTSIDIFYFSTMKLASKLIFGTSVKSMVIKLAVDLLSQLTGVQSTSSYTKNFMIFIPLSAQS